MPIATPTRVKCVSTLTTPSWRKSSKTLFTTEMKSRRSSGLKISSMTIFMMSLPTDVIPRPKKYLPRFSMCLLMGILTLLHGRLTISSCYCLSSAVSRRIKNSIAMGLDTMLLTSISVLSLTSLSLSVRSIKLLLKLRRKSIISMILKQAIYLSEVRKYQIVESKC